jgi:PEP-CTERM motif
MAHLPSSRQSQRRRGARPQTILAGVAITILVLAGTLFRLARSLDMGTYDPSPRPIASLALDSEPVTLADASVRIEEEDRPVFPYSIIPGGARSKEALKRSIETDPVVRAHYANFDVASTRVVRLTQPRLAYVSYRMGSAVYWTRRPLVLHAGETILTDGRHFARTRCGNQLAAAPPVVSDDEPSLEVLNTPLPLLHRALWVPKLPGLGGLPAAANDFVMDFGWPTRGIASIPGLIATAGVPDPQQPSLEGDASPFPYAANEPPAGPPPTDSLPPVTLPPGSTPPDDPQPPLVPPDDPTPPDTPNPPHNPPTDPPNDPPSDPPNDPPNDPPVSVPEPATLLLLVTGAGGLILRRKQ